jgi:hypothetical protein
MNHRLMPPASGALQSITVNGRTYAAAPGAVVDVPDFDSTGLQANGWTLIAPSGPTSARPSGALGPNAAIASFRFYDTTLGALIFYDGATWRSPVNGNAV